MKKKFLLFTLLMAAGLTLASCNAISEVPTIDPGDGGEPNAPWVDYTVPFTEIKIAKEDKSISLNKNDTKQISYTTSPRNAVASTLTWLSSDADVATVEGGLVTAVGGGDCEITVKNDDGSIFDTAQVTVNVPIIDFTLSTDHLDLDLYQEADVLVTFNPSDTTYRNLVWESDNEAVTVSGGHIAAHSTVVSGVKVTAKSEELNKTLEVTVNVTDEWNYVDSVSLTVPENRYEVDKEFNLSATVTGKNSSNPISTAETVKYSTSTPEFVEVDENTGKVTALNAGAAKLKASILDTRNNTVVESNEVTVNVYEVKVTAVALTAHSHDTVNLDNVTNNSLDLDCNLTLNEPGAAEPSREKVEFTSSNPDVVAVNKDTGEVSVVGKGSARVTVAVIGNPDVNDYVDFNVTMLSTKVALTCAVSVASVGQQVLLTASTTPSLDKLNNSEITFEKDVTDEKATLTDNHDGTATLVAHESGVVTVTAKNGATVSNEVTLTFKKDFIYGEVYIVGSKDFSSGTSVDNGTSWTDADKAFQLDEPVGKGSSDPADLISQVRGTVTFEAGDEFKLRSGKDPLTDKDIWYQNLVWNESTQHVDEYVEHAGAIADGKVTVYDGEGEAWGNIKVVVSGTYRVLFKTYESGYSIYIDELPTFRFDSAPSSIHVDQVAHAYLKDWKTSINVTKNNDNISMNFNETTGELTLTGVSEGSTEISATDAEKTIKHTVTVTAKLTDFEEGHHYLVGSSNFAGGEAGTSWDDVSKALEFEIDTAQPKGQNGDLAAQYKAVISLKAGDEFKFRNGPGDEGYPNVWAEQGGAIPTHIARGETEYGVNFVVNTTGKYTIYLKNGTDGGYSTWIGEPEIEKTMTIDKTSLNVQVGHTATIKASDFTGTLQAVSGTTANVTVESVGTDGTITVMGVTANSSSIITISDSKTSLTCTVNVTAGEVPHDITIYFAGVSGWSSITEMHFALDDNWVSAVATTGADADIGQYKYVFETTSNASSLNCWFKQYEENADRYRHPTSGSQDWDTDYSTIKLGSITLEPGNSYVITYTGWHYNYENWIHAWFNYTLTKVS